MAWPGENSNIWPVLGPLNQMFIIEKCIFRICFDFSSGANLRGFWNFGPNSIFSLIIMRFEAKKSTSAYANTHLKFELHFWDFFPSKFGPILALQ